MRVKKILVTAMLAVGLGTVYGQTPAEPTPVVDDGGIKEVAQLDAPALKIPQLGELNGEIGVYLKKWQYENKTKSDIGYGSAYVDLKFISKKFGLISFGASLIGHERIYQRTEDDNYTSKAGRTRSNGQKGYYYNFHEVDALLYHLYLRGYSPSGKSSLTVGRQDIGDIFGQYPSLAATLEIGEVKDVKILFGAWNEQADVRVKHLKDFATVENTTVGEDDEVWFLNVELTKKIKKTSIEVTPYYYYTQDTIEIPGLHLGVAQNISEVLCVGVNADVQKYIDKIDGQENGDIYGLEGFVKQDKNFRVSVGMIRSSDDATCQSGGKRNLINSNYFDGTPDTDAADAFRNDAKTYYTQLSKTIGAVTIGLKFADIEYGKGKGNGSNHLYQTGISAKYKYDSFSWSVGFCEHDFKDKIIAGDDNDYWKIATNLSYKFKVKNIDVE